MDHGRTLVSALGVYFSVVLDTPTGATIVCTRGGVLILMFFVYLLLVRKRQSTALGKAPVVDEAKDRVFQKHP
jgi:hypothetical protein